MKATAIVYCVCNQHWQEKITLLGLTNDIRNDYGNDQGTIGMINGTLESDVRNDRNGHDGNEID